jgi:putative peptidoglycan lipid II flippase
MEFPLGLFGIALATVTLPYLSRLWSNDLRQEFAETLDWSMKIAMLISIPAAIGLVVLAEPLVTTLFYGGSFDRQSVLMTAMALQAYALGLVGFSFVKVLAPAFFAREDTKTPVRIGIIALVVNAVLSIALAWFLSRRGFAGPHVGLALATSVAALLNAGLLYRGLLSSGVLSHGTGWIALCFRVLLANAAMLAMLLFLHQPLDWWLDAGFSGRVIWLAITVAAAIAVYFGSLYITGMRHTTLRLKN